MTRVYTRAVDDVLQIIEALVELVVAQREDASTPTSFSTSRVGLSFWLADA